MARSEGAARSLARLCSCCMALACTVSSDQGASFTGSGPTTPSTTASAGTLDETSDGSSSAEGSSGTDATSGMTMGDTSASSTVTTTGASTSTGGGGPACTNAGDIVVAGASGPANANQNCPTTTYTAIVAAGPEPIADIEVLFSASVATTSEFTLSLQSPGGTTVVLFDQHGDPFSDDFVGTHFDDAAPAPIATAPAPRTGCYSPDQPMSAFNGQSANGTWTLTVQTCLFAVTVSSWELRVTH